MTDLPIEPPPVEPTNGAGTMPLDPPQGDVSQDPTPDLDEAEHAALLATTGGTTAHAVLAYEASQIGQGEHPPGSNHNKYTTWYGADDAWCFMFQDYCFNHFGALDLVHGKHAYVPDFKAIFSPRGEFHTSSPRLGDLVAFDFNFSGEPEHIGIVEKVISGSTIQTIEGNTSDHVMRRTRSRSYVYGYATPNYGATPTPTPHQEDDMPDYVSLGLKSPQAVKKGAAARVRFDVEYSDAGKAHQDGSFPGILSGGKNGTQFVVEVDASGPGSFRLIETDPAKNYAVTKTYPVRSGAFTYVGLCDPDQHLYVELQPSADGVMGVSAKATYWHR